MKHLTSKHIKFMEINNNHINITISKSENQKLLLNILNLNNDCGSSKEITYSYKQLCRDLSYGWYNKWFGETRRYKRQYWNKDCFLENVEIPKFSEMFYFLFYIFERVPTPYEMFDGYFYTYCIDKGSGIFAFKESFEPKIGERGKPLPPKETLYINTLKCRISNCYPSLVRELGCLLSLCDNADNNLCFFYDLSKDIHWDTDICCQKDDKCISIALYNQSVNSLNKRSEKEINNSLKNESFKISVLADVFGNYGSKNTTDFGGLCLYNNAVIKTIIEVILNNHTGNYMILNNKKLCVLKNE